MIPFRGIKSSTTSISATTATGRTPFLKQPTGRHQIRLCNNSTTAVRYEVGDSTVTATAASPALPAGAVEVVTVLNNPASPDTHIAAITDSGTATLEITTGAGI